MVQTFEQIRKAKPDRLYLVADGPRDGEEKKVTEECRSIIEGMADWGCHITKIYAEKNLGCRERVASGITCVLKEEERAVVLEDDCVPDLSFFRFMDEMLERYQGQDRVFLVSGRNNLGKYDEGNYDYYFARHGPNWGWGTWRRSWELYDIDMAHWPEVRDKRGAHLREWMGWKEWVCKKKANEDTYTGKIDTWDYQMIFSMQYHRKVCIVPSVNLVRNIGNGEDATHSAGADGIAAVPSYEMKFPLRHPGKIEVHGSYDRAYSRQAFEKGFWRFCLCQVVKKVLKAFTGKEYGRKDFPAVFRKKPFPG